MFSDNLVSTVSIQEILSKGVEGRSISEQQHMSLMRSDEDNNHYFCCTEIFGITIAFPILLLIQESFR